MRLTGSNPVAPNSGLGGLLRWRHGSSRAVYHRRNDPAAEALELVAAHTVSGSKADCRGAARREPSRLSDSPTNLLAEPVAEAHCSHCARR